MFEQARRERRMGCTEARSQDHRLIDVALGHLVRGMARGHEEPLQGPAGHRPMGEAGVPQPMIR
jgi:hypothetical protein